MKAKKLLAIMLATVTIATMFGGCAGEKEEKQSSAQSEVASLSKQEESKTQEESEPIEISYLSLYCGDIEDDNYVEKIIEDKLGIELKVEKVDISEQSQVQLMLASGEAPDCAWQLGNALTNYQDGLLRTIPEDMIREYAPNYAALLDSDPYGWKLHMADDGNRYALSGYVYGRYDGATFCSTYRLDWLEKLNIKPNGELIQLDEEGRVFLATEPFTKSQFVEIMEGFTNGDPDGNGTDDTYGMTAASTALFSWSGLYSMFGLSQGGAMEENGDVNMYYATESYKEFLKFVQTLYSKGYIDQEFATLDNTKAWQKVGSNKVGYACASYDWVGESVSWAQGRPPMIIPSQTEGKVVIVPSEINDDGTGGTLPYDRSNYSYTFTVDKDVDDEKLAKILQFFDYTTYNTEDAITLRYGEEGVHFEYTLPDNKGPALLEGVELGKDTGLLVYKTDFAETREFKELSLAPDQVEVFKFRNGDGAKRLTYPDRFDPFNETKVNEYMAEATSVGTIVNEFFYDVVTGKKDADKDWAEYIKTLNEAGYDKIHDEWQKAPSYKELMGMK